MTNVFGCWNGISYIHWRCSRTSSLTDDDFFHNGVSYSIRKLTLNVTADTLEVTLNRAFPQDIRTAGTLHVGSSKFSFSNAENTKAGQNIGDPVSAIDADGDLLIYTLSGAEARFFGISRNNGQLKTKAPWTTRRSAVTVWW